MPESPLKPARGLHSAAFVAVSIAAFALSSIFLWYPAFAPSQGFDITRAFSLTEALLTAQKDNVRNIIATTAHKTAPELPAVSRDRIDVLLTQASNLAWDKKSALAIKRAHVARASIANLEAKAKRLLRAGDYNTGLAILNSPRYSNNLRNLTDNIDSFIKQVHAKAERQLARSSDMNSTLRRISLSTLPALFAALLFLFYLSQRKAISHSRRTAQWEAAHSTLTDMYENCGNRLQNSHATLDAIFKHMPAGMAIYRPLSGDNDFAVVQLNPAAEIIDKITNEDARGRKISEIMPEAISSGLLGAMLKVSRTGNPLHYPITTYSEGTIIGWRENHIAKLPDGNILCVFEDATRRKKAEDQLMQSEKRFRSIFDHIDSGILLVGRDGCIEGINETATKICRATPSKAVEQTFPHDVVEDENSLKSIQKAITKARKGERTSTQARILRCGDNTSFDAELAFTTMDYATGTLLVTIRDITQMKTTTERLRRMEQRFRDVALLSANWIWEVNAEGYYTYASPQVENITGYTPEELYEMSPFDLMPPGEDERVAEIFHRLVRENKAIYDLENDFVTKDGRQGTFLTNGIPLFDDQGKLTGYFGIDKDITQKKEDEQSLKLFQKVFSNALEGITITDASGNIIAVNPAFTKITGYSNEEVIGQNPRLFKSDRHDEGFYQKMWEDITTKGAWAGEIWNRRKNGEAFPEWLSISAIRDAQGNTTHFVSVFHDIGEIKRQERQLAHREYHDPLTDLPNKLLLHDRLQMAIAHAKRINSKVGVMLMDLDNFKNINDSLGHHAGDKLIQKVASRMSSLLRSEDTIARLGGDEFAIMIQAIDEVHDAILLAERIIHDFTFPYTVKGQELYVTPSIGICLFPDDGDTTEAMLRNADTAMYKAKDSGKNTYQLFSSGMNRDILRRLTIESSMRKSLFAEEFIIHFQPRISLPNEAPRSMEALVRWPQPDGTIMSPADFIPLAEETGLIIPLGEQVLEMACRHTHKILLNGVSDMSVSVNLSPRQFQQANLVNSIKQILEKTGLPPTNLELEITETTLTTNMEDATTKLAMLSEMGIRLAIDDFGTGYSSLYYLRHMPIDILKVDGSFIRDVPGNKDAESIVEAILLIAEKLGLCVVAEGVETMEQVDFLKVRGCQEIQGFHYSKPLPLPELIAYLNRKK